MSITDSREPLLTTGEAARLIGVSHDTVLRWCQRDKIRAVKLPSGHWRIQRHDIADLVPVR